MITYKLEPDGTILLDTHPRLKLWYEGEPKACPLGGPYTYNSMWIVKFAQGDQERLTSAVWEAIPVQRDGDLIRLAIEDHDRLLNAIDLGAKALSIVLSGRCSYGGRLFFDHEQAKQSQAAKTPDQAIAAVVQAALDGWNTRIYRDH